MKKKILIIDDEVDFGFLMKSFFTPKNYAVVIALTLATGMKMLDTEKPDILFLDKIWSERTCPYSGMIGLPGALE